MTQETWRQISEELQLQSDSTRCQKFLDIKQSLPPHASKLTDYSIISIAGEDADSFLQGQACCDVRTVKEKGNGLGAFCDVKGRTIATFRIIALPNRFLLLISQSLAESLIKRLTMYVLRSDVKIEDISNDWCCLSIWGEKILPLLEVAKVTQPQSISEGQPFYIPIRETQQEAALILVKHEELGQVIANLREQSVTIAGSGNWQLFEILSGIPQVESLNSTEFIPQMLNLDILEGIGFNKGCYIGQEIIARLHYLGKPKRRTFLALSQSRQSALKIGAQIYDSSNQESEKNQKCGEVLRSVFCEDTRSCYSLVVLQTEHSQSTNLFAEDDETHPIELLSLPYKVQ